MLSFVNLLLIPYITLYIQFRRGVIGSEVKPMLAGRYAVSVVANVILTFGCMNVIRIFTGIYAYPDSQTYTIVAVPVAVICAYAYEK